MRIVIFDAIGSFTKDIAAHWQKQGHEVAIHREYNPEHIVGADFIFCEWADANAAYAAQKKWPIPLVVRCHSYENFTEIPRQTAWWNVDRLLFVAEHVRDDFMTEFVPACPTTVIPNGVFTEIWTYKKRDKVVNPKVAFVGDFSHKKGMQLFLQCVAAWPKATFYIAGPAYDRRYFVTLVDAAKKAGCFERIVYQGHQKKLDQWLDDKNFILCTSPWEGHNYSLMEAMTKGIKPLIYNFPGAEKLYPEQCLWITPKEMRERSQEPYLSPAYRQWVLDKGWTAERMLADYDKILATPKGITEEDVRRYYDAFTPYMAGALQNPYGRYKHIFEFIHKHIGKGDSVMDLACGVGITTAEIKQITPDVFGIDVSEKAVEVAVKQYPDISFAVKNLLDIQTTQKERLAQFNWVGCLFDCLEHLLPEQRQKLYGKIGGFDKILITVPIKQRRAGNRLQIIDEEIELEEIQKAFPNHFVSATEKYGVEYADQYRFVRLDRIQKAIEPEPEKELVDAAQT